MLHRKEGKSFKFQVSEGQGPLWKSKILSELIHVPLALGMRVAVERTFHLGETLGLELQLCKLLSLGLALVTNCFRPHFREKTFDDLLLHFPGC